MGAAGGAKRASANRSDGVPDGVVAMPAQPDNTAASSDGHSNERSKERSNDSGRFMSPPLRHALCRLTNPVVRCTYSIGLRHDDVKEMSNAVAAPPQSS